MDERKGIYLGYNSNIVRPVAISLSVILLLLAPNVFAQTSLKHPQTLRRLQRADKAVFKSINPQRRQPKPIRVNHCSRQSEVYNDFFKKQSSYVPGNGITTPATVVKEVKIRFVVVEKNNTGSLQRNFRPENIDDLHLMVQWLNNMMSHLAQPKNPVRAVCGACYIQDERMRVKLTDVAFINDSTKYIYQRNTRRLTKYGKDKNRVLNIYLYVDSSRWHPKLNVRSFSAGAWSGFGGALIGPDNHHTLQIFMFNTYLFAKYQHLIEKDVTYRGILWSETLRLMHELHHCLGLGHLQKNRSGNYGFDPAGCTGADYLADAFPNGCPMSYGDDSTNNIMNSSDWSNYLSPLQIGRANRSAFLGKVSKYVYPTEPPNRHPWIIRNNETWDFPIRLFQNIIVKRGATLKISCDLQMPSESQIIVQPGGHLIVDGGRITAYNNDMTWQGVDLKKHSGLFSKSQQQGQLTLLDGGKLEQTTQP